MGIYEGSKKIIRRVLDQAIKSGSLLVSIKTTYSKLAEELGLESENFCKVCIDYLSRKKYVEIKHSPDKEIFLSITIEAIDFLEQA